MFTSFTLTDADICCVALTFLAACEDTPPDQHEQAMDTHDKIEAYRERVLKRAAKDSRRAAAMGTQPDLPFEEAS